MPHFLNIKAIIKKIMIISKRVPISVKLEERKDGEKRYVVDVLKLQIGN